MKRLLTSALAAVVVAAGTGEAQAQDMMGRRASLFDLGVYAGGAYTTGWFSNRVGNDDETYKVGLSPIFGLTATYWASPSFGVRLHGAFMPSNLPEADNDIAGNDNWVQNNYLYDLDLVYRPFFWSNNGWLGSTYLFLGGGGFTMNVAGEGPVPPGGVYPCLLGYPAGVCHTTDMEYGTTGMAVVGVGTDLFPISNGLGIFGELALHGYDSPTHVFEQAGNAEDKFGFTPRAVIGLKFMFGDILPPPPVVVAPPTPPEPPQPPVVVDESRDIRVCVVENGMLTEITGRYNPATGDTMVAGQRFSERYPATTGYAAGTTWYINNETITFGDRRYAKFGLPRVVGVTEVNRLGDFQGVTVFAEPGATGTPDVIYVPVRPGCEFQAYQLEQKIRTVRGD